MGPASTWLAVLFACATLALRRITDVDEATSLDGWREKKETSAIEAHKLADM